jgi:hypothetical protein
MIDCQPTRHTTRRQRNRKEQENRLEEEKSTNDSTNTREYVYVRYCSNFSINSADTDSFFRFIFRCRQPITERSNYETYIYI